VRVPEQNKNKLRTKREQMRRGPAQAWPLFHVKHFALRSCFVHDMFRSLSLAYVSRETFLVCSWFVLPENIPVTDRERRPNTSLAYVSRETLIAFMLCSQ
jgi:hypothetical protein